MSQPFTVAEVFTGMTGRQVVLEDTLQGFEQLLSGVHDALPEQAFYMVGGIDEAISKAEKIQAETAARLAKKAAS